MLACYGISYIFFFSSFSIQATSLLVNGIKGDAEGEDDDDSQKRLLAAAKVLADATAKLVEAAKVCLHYF